MRRRAHVRLLVDLHPLTALTTDGETGQEIAALGATRGVGASRRVLEQRLQPREGAVIEDRLPLALADHAALVDEVAGVALAEQEHADVTGGPRLRRLAGRWLAALVERLGDGSQRLVGERPFRRLAADCCLPLADFAPRQPVVGATVGSPRSARCFNLRTIRSRVGSASAASLAAIVRTTAQPSAVDRSWSPDTTVRIFTECRSCNWISARTRAVVASGASRCTRGLSRIRLPRRSASSPRTEAGPSSRSWTLRCRCPRTH